MHTLANFKVTSNHNADLDGRPKLSRYSKNEISLLWTNALIGQKLAVLKMKLDSLIGQFVGILRPAWPSPRRARA